MLGKGQREQRAGEKAMLAALPEKAALPCGIPARIVAFCRAGDLVESTVPRCELKRGLGGGGQLGKGAPPACC